jgi:cytochrome c553
MAKSCWSATGLIRKQLKVFKTGKRTWSNMQVISSKLNSEKMAVVVQYYGQ